MTEFRYDTQLLIEGENLDEDTVHDHFTRHFKGDCLLAVGDENLIKIHFHTNEPWQVLDYCGGGYGPAGARLKGLSGRPDKETGQTDIGYFRRL